MKRNKSTIIWIVVATLLLVVLFAYPKLTAPKNNNVSKNDVPCLVPNIPLVQHIHPHLQILVGSKEEIVPAEIGLGGSCERALHTHATDGVIHVESQDSREYTLGDFFSVWGKSIARDGYAVAITADGEPVSDSENFKLRDGQKIVITYTKN